MEPIWPAEALAVISVTEMERVYILLNAVIGKANELLGKLLQMPEIDKLEYLDGPPDILLSLEGPDRMMLAEEVDNLLCKFGYLIESVQCFPVVSKSGKQLGSMKRH